LLARHFRPEFLNRIDEIVIFHKLKKEHLRKIVDIQLRRVRARLAEQGFGLQISEEAKAYLAEIGYDPVFGARPLKRAIQSELQDPLAIKLLAGDFIPGETLLVEKGKDGLEFSAVKDAEPVLTPNE
jgi:ATP-dependent Clp protease ATP-binding subunit ClpB